ncbi:hypothetical protein D3C73_1103190 [compost metagenome]
MLKDHLHNACRLPAEGVRVLRTGRNNADGKASDNRVDFIRKADHKADFRSRNSVSGKAWLIVLEDPSCNRFGFTGFAGIILTHGTLEFGKLIYHLRHQIEFADISRPADFSSCLCGQPQLHR